MSNGEPTNPAQGRAKVPGVQPVHGAPLPGMQRSSPDSAPPTGSAPGNAHGGGAAGGGAAGGGGSVGRASVGRASVGRAPVGPARADGPGVDPAGPRIPADRASGRASVGRASVGGVVPVERFDGDGRFSEPAMLGPGGAPVKDPRARRAKRRRRRNILVAGIAVFIMLTGVGLVGGTYYFVNVDLPADTPLAQSTMIYYSDGTTLMAKIGEESRTVLPDKEIPQALVQAAIATEDKTFATNKGVDYRGIARAAWNNVTGGQRQGASTISQQYARQIAELKEISYARKLQEAVMARKLNNTYTKEQLMARYLNTVYFGRHAYGIEAAALAYFGRPAKELTVGEAMVLTALIKEPGGALNGLTSTYDPTVNPELAQNRWQNYIKPNMVELGFLTAAEAAALEYPKTVQPFDPVKDALAREQFGLDKPTGLVVHQVMDELSKLKNSDGTPMFTDIKNDIKKAGLKIVTTIDKNMQQAAVTAASGETKDSPMFGYTDTMRSGLVAVEPGTGRVRAYYGGPNGSGTDYAGVYTDPVLGDGKMTSSGMHQPGSSAKIYTMLAALREGYTIDSYWDGTDVMEFPNTGRTKKNGRDPVRNSTKANCAEGKQSCKMWEAIEQSLNTTFYGMAETVGVGKVLELTRDTGVKSMWVAENDKWVWKDLANTPIDSLARKVFDTEIGIGQYPITVLDHAVGVSVLATRGKAANGHFVQQIFKDGKLRYAERVLSKPIDGLTPEMVDNANWALQKVVKHYKLNLAGGRESAGKTGTWELNEGDPKSNGHAWFAGVTLQGPKSPGLSTAVWAGNKGKEEALKFKNGKSIIGGDMAGPIWQKFMNLAIPKGTPMVSIPDRPKDVGDKTKGNGKAPPPPPPTDQPSIDPNNPGGNPACVNGVCPPFTNGTENGNSGNGNNGNGNGNGGGG